MRSGHTPMPKRSLYFFLRVFLEVKSSPQDLRLFITRPIIDTKQVFCTILKNSLVRGLAVDCEANRPSVLILNWSSTSPALSLLSTAPLMQVRYTQSHSVSDCISPSVTTTSLGCIREKGGGVHIDGYLSKASIHVFCLLNITECDGLYYAVRFSYRVSQTCSCIQQHFDIVSD